MKKLVLLLLLFAQYGFAAPFTVTGKVNHPALPYVVFFTHDPLYGINQRDTVKLGPDGSFKYVVEIPGKRFQYFHIEADDKRSGNMIGYAGQTLTVSFIENVKEPVFSGQMAKIQQFSADDMAHWKKVYEGYVKRNPWFEKKDSLRTDNYFKIQDSITNDRINNLKAFFKGTKQQSEQDFLKHQTLHLIYSDLYYKQSYNEPPFEKYKFYRDKFKVTSSATYKYSDMVTFDDPALCNIEGYTRFFNSFMIGELYNRRQQRKIQFSWKGMIIQGFELIDELSSNPQANNRLKLTYVANLIDDLERDKNIERAIEIQEQLKISKINDPKFMLDINKRLTNFIRIDKFKKGKPAPDFTFSDTLGRVVTLQSLKGKRIVIDVAASWCGPCINGIPDWNKRVAEDKDPETVYVFLSLDNTMEEGMELFRKHAPKGTLLFAGNGGFKSKFAKDYEISLLPGQVIIDKEGKFEAYGYN